MEWTNGKQNPHQDMLYNAWFGHSFSEDIDSKHNSDKLPLFREVLAICLTGLTHFVSHIDRKDFDAII